jgi:hypothetical protein
MTVNCRRVIFFVFLLSLAFFGVAGADVIGLLSERVELTSYVEYVDALGTTHRYDTLAGVGERQRHGERTLPASRGLVRASEGW